MGGDRKNLITPEGKGGGSEDWTTSLPLTLSFSEDRDTPLDRVCLMGGSP